MKLRIWLNSFYFLMYMAALLGICVLLYVLALPLDKRFDLTGDKRFTLSNETVKILKQVADPISVYAFYHADQREQAEALEDILKSVQASNRLIRYELVELDRDPVKASHYGVENYGEIVVEQASRRVRVWSWTEEALTNGILQLGNNSLEKIYFTEGHGELELNSDERRGLGRLKGRLAEENYDSLPLLLAETKEIPENASAVLVVSPKADFFEEEIDRLENYLTRGGSLLIFLDPMVDGAGLPLFESFLLKYGISAGKDVVIDEKSQSYGADSVVATIQRFGEHPITQGVRGDVVLPLARSIRPAPAVAKLTDLTVVAATSEVSWAETDLKTLEQGSARYGEEDGPIGFIPVGVIAEGRSVEPGRNKNREHYRILAFGDSDFISNSLIQYGGHQALISSALAWMTHREQPLAIKTQSIQATPLYLSAQNQKRLFLTLVIFIPLTVAFTGIVIHLLRFRVTPVSY